MANLRPRNISEYWQMLWRRKFLIFLFAAAMMIATYTAIAPIPNVYEAKSLVAITIHSSEERETVDVQVAAVNQYLLSRTNLEPIVRKYKVYGENADIENAIGELKRNTTVETKLRDYYPQFPISFTITYKHNNPELAMKVTNELASYFSSTSEMLEKRAGEEVRVLNATISDLENQLKQINQQRLAKSGSNKEIIRVQRASLMASIDNLTDKEFGLSQRVAHQKRQIADQEKIVAASPVSVSDNGRGTSAYGVLLSQKAQLLAQLKDQTSQYTDKNSKVIQTRNQIAELDRQLAQYESVGNGQSGASGFTPEMRDLRVLQRDLANIETEVELNQRELARKRQSLALLPTVDVSPTIVASADAGVAAPYIENQNDLDGGGEYGLMFNRLSKLTERRDSLMRLGDVNSGSNNTSLFQVVDKAVLPQAPVAPNRIKLMLMAFVLSIGVGLIAALSVELPRLALINDERDVEYYLGAPVVGLIPETLTPSENSRKRKFVLVRALFILLFVISLVPILALVFKKTQVFQIFAK
ncbi:MAG: hypothetical protein SF097_28240 [Acidobacteriota bacterium]|nr:hypothetical protein [Acidobacteriota bacterium]